MDRTERLARLPYRELERLLRERGMPRREADTKQTMAERLAAQTAPDARLPAAEALAVRPVWLLEGPPTLVRRAARFLRPFGLRFLSSGALAVPLGQQSTVRRALHRAGIALIGQGAVAPDAPVGATPEPDGSSGRPEPAGARVAAVQPPSELVAAGLFVRELAGLLDWPEAAIGEVLRRGLPADAAAAGPEVARRLDLWRALWEQAIDGAVAVPEEDRPEAPDNPDRLPEPVVAARLEQAIAERRCAHLVYLTAARSARTVRVVEPRALHRYRDQIYLHAYCHSRQDLRTFRLSRIVWVELLDEIFEGWAID